MTRSARISGQAGFTLIELLITMTLLSFLLLLLLGGLHFGVRAWDSAQAHGVRADELRVVQSLLRGEIEEAYPATDAADPVHPVIDFQGSETALTFLAPPPQAAQSGGRSRITFSAVRAGGSIALTVQGLPELATTPAGGWSSPLLRNLAAVQFAYFGPDGWTTAWSHKNAMPNLVRVRVTFPRGDGRVWPDLIVAPQIAVDTPCAAGVVSALCRSPS
jgi:general secretion pathway protein J